MCPSFQLGGKQTYRRILIKRKSGQFEIIKFRHGSNGKDLTINGKDCYFRVLIKRKEKNNGKGMATASAAENDDGRASR